MGTLLPQLLSFPPYPTPSVPIPNTEYDHKARSLVKVLRETNAGKLSGPVSGQDTILDIVNPATHSLPYLYALISSLQAKSVPLRIGDSLWEKVAHFLTEFDPVQVRYSGTEFRSIVETVAGCISQDPPIVLNIISAAILRLDPSGATLTSTHVLLLRLSLKTKNYEPAQLVLDHDIYHVPTPAPKNEKEREALNIPLPCGSHAASSTFITSRSGLSAKLEYQDHLLYFLYGAMIYISLWKFERSLSLLEVVITAPVSMAIPSMIQVEAYKKWLLLNLLVFGKPRPMPKNVAGNASKHLKALSKAYEIIGDKFKDSDPAKLRAEIQAGPFAHDSNFSLALLVVSAHQRFKVQSLSQTYVSLPLSRVASLAFTTDTPVEDIESYIRNLISNGQLPGASLGAQSNSGDPEIFLSFLPKGTAARTEADLYRDLLLQRKKVETLGTYINDTQRKIETSKEYVDALRKMRKQDAKNTKDGLNDSNSMPGAFDDDMVADM